MGVAVEAFNEMLARIEGALSERKRAEEALLALNTTLEERVAERTAAAEQKTAELQLFNQELEQFAYVASHDLQEPLRAVRSFTQLIEVRIRATLDPETTVYFSHVLEAVARMHALINDLLTYARVGRTTLTRGPVDFGAVVEAALADSGPSLKECDARVLLGPLPVVVGDGVRLGQLIRNLITNAIRFRSSEPPRIQISAERRGDDWQFAVRDNGIGIAPRHQERIFVIFQRLHGRDRPGTGIGLAICRKIVEMHGGTIWVQSELGKGLRSSSLSQHERRLSRPACRTRTSPCRPMDGTSPSPDGHCSDGRSSRGLRAIARASLLLPASGGRHARSLGSCCRSPAPRSGHG